MAVEPTPEEREAWECLKARAERMGVTPSALMAQESLERLREAAEGESPQALAARLEERRRSIDAFLDVFHRHEVDDTLENVRRLQLESGSIGRLLESPDLLDAFRRGEPGWEAALRGENGDGREPPMDADEDR